jgi:hypothetical protein
MSSILLGHLSYVAAQVQDYKTGFVILVLVAQKVFLFYANLQKLSLEPFSQHESPGNPT